MVWTPYSFRLCFMVHAPSSRVWYIDNLLLRRSLWPTWFIAVNPFLTVYDIEFTWGWGGVSCWGEYQKFERPIILLSYFAAFERKWYPSCLRKQIIRLSNLRVHMGHTAVNQLALTFWARIWKQGRKERRKRKGIIGGEKGADNRSGLCFRWPLYWFFREQLRTWVKVLPVGVEKKHDRRMRSRVLGVCRF